MKQEKLLEVPKPTFGQLAEVIFAGARQATKYVSEKLTVKLTRKLFKGRIDKRENSMTLLLTIGVPNYTEREFIKKAKAAGEPFPIKKIQIKWPKVRR